MPGSACPKRCWPTGCRTAMCCATLFTPQANRPKKWKNEDADMMETAQDDAVRRRPARRWAAGHRDAGHLFGHRRWPGSQALASGRSGGFCRRRGHSLTTMRWPSAIRAHRVGEKVRFVVIRNKVQTDVTVTTVESTRPIRCSGRRHHLGHRLPLRPQDLLRPRPTDRRPQRRPGVRAGDL